MELDVATLTLLAVIALMFLGTAGLLASARDAHSKHEAEKQAAPPPPPRILFDRRRELVGTGNGRELGGKG